MKLYIADGSPNCRKVQATVEYLNFPVDIEVIDFASGWHKSSDYLQINPNGRVPALVDDDLKLWESNAIIQYFGSKKPSSLFPEHFATRIDIVRWLCWELAHYGEAVGTIVWENFAKGHFGIGDADPKLLQLAIERFHQYAAVLEAQLKGRSFILGENVTLADFSLASHAAFIEAAQLPLDDYQNIQNWYARLNTISAWQKSLPSFMGQQTPEMAADIA